MRLMLAMISTTALLGACQRKADDTGARRDNERSGTDTTIESQSIKDTTIVRKDTTIDVDTLKKTDHIDEKNNR